MSERPPAHSHPSPHRHAVPVALVLVALGLGPGAWVLQLVADFALASAACFPRDAPRLSSPPPGWAHEGAGLLAINLVCLATTLVGLSIAWLCWRRTHREDRGEMRATADIGEGRSRFLATCGMFANFGFAVAIGFDTVAVLGTPTCWSIAS